MLLSNSFCFAEKLRKFAFLLVEGKEWINLNHKPVVSGNKELADPFSPPSDTESQTDLPK